MNLLLIILITIITTTMLFMVVKNVKTPNGLGIEENGKLSELPESPNAVSSFTKDKEKYVKPLEFKGNLNQTKIKIKTALNQYGNIEIKSETNNYIHAISTTKVMKYHDDLEFLFDEKEEVVHFRSASRIGYSDMGLNRKRYDKLKEIYKTIR